MLSPAFCQDQTIFTSARTIAPFAKRGSFFKRNNGLRTRIMILKLWCQLQSEVINNKENRGVERGKCTPLPPRKRFSIFSTINE